jgi:hypothetical protein
MKFYITEETKQELEAKIEELKNELHEETDEYSVGSRYAALNVYQKILESSIVLPVEENFEVNNTIISEKKWMFDKYPNGVIINKQ